MSISAPTVGLVEGSLAQHIWITPQKVSDSLRGRGGDSPCERERTTSRVLRFFQGSERPRTFKPKLHEFNRLNNERPRTSMKMQPTAQISMAFEFYIDMPAWTCIHTRKCVFIPSHWNGYWLIPSKSTIPQSWHFDR